jgi:hypothetical protein
MLAPVHTEPETLEAPAGESHTADRVSTTILLVGSGLISLILLFAGLMLIMSTDSCGVVNECNTGLFSVAWLLSMLIPLAGFVATVVFTFVRIKRKQSSWWVPLAGTAIIVALFAIDVAIAFWVLDA